MTDWPEGARLVGVTLDDRSLSRTSPEVEHERATAIFDLIEENRFRPVSGAQGPYHLHLSVSEGRLIFDIETPDRLPIERVVLPLAPLRRIVRDYFVICDSYFNAIRKLMPSQIEAIDMGRRGLHNEGAELLEARLAGKVEIDHDTARRLFTLLCVLHVRS